MSKRLLAARKSAVLAVLGSSFAFPLGSCNLADFTTTTTTTLDGREVVSYIIRSAILTPIQTLIDTAIDRAFDRLEGDDDEA